MSVRHYTAARNAEEVEFEFDNKELEGYINIEKFRDSDEVLLNLDFHKSFTFGGEAVTVLEVEDLKIPKEGLIEFLEKTLEMLKSEEKIMKLTNEQKAHNSARDSGIKVLKNKIEKLEKDLQHEQKTIELNEKFRNERELADARCTVSEWQVKLIKGLIKQLDKSISVLSDTKFK